LIQYDDPTRCNVAKLIIRRWHDHVGKSLVVEADYDGVERLDDVGQLELVLAAAEEAIVGFFDAHDVTISSSGSCSPPTRDLLKRAHLCSS
jgi:hypothetical protein